MANHLVAQVFASHGAPWPEPGAPVRLGVDHVLLDERDGVIALLGFEALARPRVRCAVAIVAPAREAEGPDARADLAYLQSAAAALGATFVRPGAGPPAATYRRAFAAPGRTLLASVPGASGAGALGALVLPGEPTDAAVALAGEPLLLARPRVVGVRLVGEPRPGVGGAELIAALADLLEGEGRDAIVEYHGDGVAALAVPDRVAMATLGGALLGALASLFPSDARTRAHLGSRGRDADWRAVAGGSEGFDAVREFDLERVRPLREAPARVRVGALAEDEDLLALAAVTRGERSLADWTVVAGGRAARASAAVADALAALARAGATVVNAGEGRSLGPLEPDTFACGEDPRVLGGRVRAISAAALAHAFGVSAGEAPTLAAALDAAERIAPAPVGDTVTIERVAAHRLPLLPAAMEGSPRGPVVWAAPRDVALDEILAWGPRVRAHRADAVALAALAFAGEGEGGVRAAVHGVVAIRGRWGDGAPHEPPARALAALGVRVVIAADFPPAHARALAAQGVLPLRWRRSGDALSIVAGDELELPGLAETLARGGRLTVRDLTRGLAFDVLSAVDGERLEIARAGGRLATLAREPQASES